MGPPLFVEPALSDSEWVGRSFGKLRTGSRPTPSTGAIGFVWRDRSRSSQRGGGKLGSFRASAPRPTPPGPRPARPRRANWVRFAHFAFRGPARPAELASFCTFDPPNWVRFDNRLPTTAYRLPLFGVVSVRPRRDISFFVTRRTETSTVEATRASPVPL
jgi:hypothetical protein